MAYSISLQIDDLVNISTGMHIDSMMFSGGIAINPNADIVFIGQSASDDLAFVYHAESIKSWTIDHLDAICSHYSYQTTGQAFYVADVLLNLGLMRTAEISKFTDRINRNFSSGAFMYIPFSMMRRS